MAEIVELQTDRLRLRQWRTSDLVPFADLNSDQRVMKYYPALLDQHESDAMAERIKALIEERGWGFWAVEKIDGKQFIGFVGLHNPSEELPFSPCVEIGWRLAFEHWGKGYATEAASAALTIGFETLGFNEIVSFTSLSNLRSCAVMQRLGMRDSGENFQHPDISEDNPLRDHCLYRLSLPAWRDYRLIRG